jgi:two-component system cell cycle response regulator
MVGKILIVDDIATNRIVLKVKLTAAGYLPIMAHDGAACLAAAVRERPDLILLDLMLPDMSGLDVLAQLRANPDFRDVPVVMFSASQDPAFRAKAFRLGADEFLTKPIDDQTLLARIRSFMRARDLREGFTAHQGGIAMLGLAEAASRFQAPGIIALVTGKAETGMLLRRDMAVHLSDRVLVMTPEEALNEGLNPGATPDVFLIEADFNGPGSGLRLMSELRSRTYSRHAAFSVMTQQGSSTLAAVAFDLGANDMPPASVPGEELAMRLRRLLSRKREADAIRASVQDGLRLAMIDPLTGLHNRRYGIAQLGVIAESARKSGQPYAVMVVDIDRFKSVNDRWGHAAGDAVLIEVAMRLTRNLRMGDLLARIGGEEFLIALPDTDLASARSIADRLCRVIAQDPIPLADTAHSATVSIGLAVSVDGARPQIKDTVAEIVDRADRALLTAKSGGRNQVMIGKSAA